MVERLTVNQMVRGSSPWGRAKFMYNPSKCVFTELEGCLGKPVVYAITPFQNVIGICEKCQRFLYKQITFISKEEAIAHFIING